MSGSWPSTFVPPDDVLRLITLLPSILMDRLSVWYGVSGIALSWFRSYLSGRHQRVKIGDCFSSPLNISCGVPQGSVLGPLLFTLYTTPLSLVINRHHLSHHLYADDTQMYISLSTSDASSSLQH